ncbi:Phage-like element PBSX protein, XkdF [uncultured Caudovirales phage]|uniref:Phage-like element PBSX protein, XkdF n=1 Tax=uncultured Caudovirales phage TaxID=2100421 RepID=A0A6J7WJI9_9CAUD|nr:Phage-like element PBSX protein, XkdF [uncultured Caudovirales phage]
MKKLEDIELKIENENEDGVFAISLVDRPAIQEHFIALSEHNIELKVVDEDKRILVGLALVPNKKIYRNVNGKEFNVFFSEQTIEKTNELFMRNLNLNSITSQHETKVSGVSVIESWIVEDEKNDKSNLYNLNAIKGSWAVKMKVYNDEEWNKVKLGEYKGFSIEGIYQGLDKLQASEQPQEEEDFTTDIIEFLKSI